VRRKPPSSCWPAASGRAEDRRPRRQCTSRTRTDSRAGVSGRALRRERGRRGGSRTSAPFGPFRGGETRDGLGDARDLESADDAVPGPVTPVRIRAVTAPSGTATGRGSRRGGRSRRAGRARRGWGTGCGPFSTALAVFRSQGPRSSPGRAPTRGKRRGWEQDLLPVAFSGPARWFPGTGADNDFRHRDDNGVRRAPAGATRRREVRR
jgi:hypothetical protein